MHPVIVGTNADFERVRRLCNTDAFISPLYARAIRKADELLLTSAEVRYADAINYDAAFNLERLDLLTFVYVISGDERYFNRAVEELDAISELDDWQTFKFLNTAAFGMGAAMAYDRLYERLGEERRVYYRDTIKRLILEPAKKAYAAAETEPFGSVGWSKCRTNWNAVCNGAVICAASAIYDDEPEYAKVIITDAVASLKLFLDIFEPHGAFEEGISYWFYANLYLSKAVSTLNNLFGTDGDILCGSGFAKSMEYAEAMNHDAYNFNFHDVGTERRIDTSPLMYYARRLDMPELGRSRTAAFRRGFLPIADEVSAADMLWYDEAYAAPPGIADKDVYFPISETCILRSGDIAAALHGGDNAAVHGHLDNGTVILDAMGERWLCDLGKDMYTYSIEGSMRYRWDLYRMRPEGHNCLVFNPSAAPGQELDAVAKIIEFESGEISRAVLDLTSSYENAECITREITLDKAAREVTITDKIKLCGECEIYSFWHTRAEAETDGCRAVLKSGGSCAAVECNYPLGVMGAEPMPCSPVVDGQTPNDDAKKLYIRIPNTKEAEIILRIKL